MNDPDQTMMFFANQNNGTGSDHQKTERLDDAWTEDEFTTDDEQDTADRATTFVSLAFITAALKRSAWLCCAIALFGLVVGYATYVKYPPADTATASVLLVNNPDADSTEQSQTNIVLAESQAVAQRALQQLGLNQSVGSFLAAYSVTASSDQVLVFNVSGPSSSAAVQRAAALATAFLQFRAGYLENQQHLQVTLAQQQVTAAGQQVDLLNRQISALTAQGAVAGQSNKLATLQTQLTAAQGALSAAQQNETTAVDSTASVTASMVRGSQILNTPTAAPRTLKDKKVFYLVVAFIASLAIGAAIVIIRALLSDRLRVRDDIADAIGAPIMLSTGQIGTNWLPRLGRRGRKRARDVRRLESHLNGAVRVGAGVKKLASLAVVAVDNAPDAVPAVVALAMDWVGQGKKVVLTDLSGGTYAARKFGVRHPGVHKVSVGGGELTVSVPDPDEIPPVGPLPAPSHQQFGRINPDLAAACDSADCLLTLVTLDPVTGGEYLRTWATEAVAVVTAGRSSSVRIRAVGEMIRLAGIRLTSVALLDADQSDESLGARRALEQFALPL